MIMYSIERSELFMKAIGKFLLELVIGVWLMSIFVTVCLLSYNDFRVSTFGKTSLLIIDSEEMEPDFEEGDLLIIKRNSDSKINIGDKVFYYNSAKDSDVWVYYDTVQEKIPLTRDETTFVLNSQKVSGEYIIGRAEGAKVMHKVGTLLAIFTSRWGFMFLVIFPMLFAIIYEIMMIIEARRELKMAKNNE